MLEVPPSDAQVSPEHFGVPPMWEVVEVKVLDACCGSKMMWFDRNDARALFVDKRRETHPIDIGTSGTVGRAPIVVDPDILADFSELPFPDDSFHMVVFDPPHIERLHALGLLTKKYGILCGDWRDMLRRGFSECFRVLKPNGTLIFKWAESDHPVASILELTDEKPLFGHKSGAKARTHWLVFMKAECQPSSFTENAVEARLFAEAMARGVSAEQLEEAEPNDSFEQQ